MSTEELDKIDREILHILSNDGRISLKDIGEKIALVNEGQSLSHVAISNRIKKLTPKYLNIQANLQLRNLGISAVYILLETKDYDTQRKMIEKSRLCPRIASLETLSGKYNIILKVVADNAQDIDCFITCAIKSDDMIRNFQILHCTNQIKPKYSPITILSQQEKRLLRTPCGQNCAFCSMYKDNVCSGCPGSKYSQILYQNLNPKST